MRLVITYDVSDDSKRRQIYKILESYGAWKQYSVFEVEVSRTERVELEDRLKDHLGEEDNIRIYMICSSCQGKITTLGRKSDGEMSNVI